MYKVYGLICPTRKTIRYVGVTGRTLQERLGEHLWDSRDKNPYKYNWIQKLKRNKKTPGIILLFESSSEDEAYEKEIELITLFRKTIGKKLTNISGGGTRPPILLGEKNPFYGKGHTQMGEKNPFYGKKHSEKTLKHFRKPVAQFSLDGQLIETFAGVREAAAKTGLGRSSIIKVCKGRRKTAGNFIWKYA